MKKLRRKQGESLEQYMERVRSKESRDTLQAIEAAAKKTGMIGDGQERNARWRIAELERRMTLSESEFW
jgi:hypothetical protein